jgi:hypothetical protein
MAPKKLEKKLKKANKAITITKQKEIVQKCDRGVCVTHVANMYTL